MPRYGTATVRTPNLLLTQSRLLAALFFPTTPAMAALPALASTQSRISHNNAHVHQGDVSHGLGFVAGANQVRADALHNHTETLCRANQQTVGPFWPILAAGAAQTRGWRRF